ncbi:hypothetical protein [Paenibacillus glacialis]|uniref:Uncharacterized protein n=1 Tax=Paenibacillus glacialis TaxID=494026 RepID=A0A168N5J5_9BACL|nr:hypothetical protein [Paenibacillus glacialis]OAB45414.1 hypothetical protein PGLA_03955 [Paenibacillus glacialis]
MHTQLMNETFQLLQAECSPKAGIALDIDRTEMLVTESLLNSYDLAYERKVHLLALYTVLKLATSRHKDCNYSDPNLTRKVLDGDYLYSLYIQLAVQFEEIDLISYLAPHIKKWQIRGAEGHSEVELLYTCLEQFLNLEFRRNVSTATVEQVG